MLDPRHPEDSLFFVAESDYRFYPEDCVESWYEIVQDEEQPWLHEQLLVETAPPVMEDPPSPAPATDTEPSPAPAEEAPARPPKKRRGYQGWMAAQRTALTANEVEVSRELRDLVQICNRAAMIGRGHVVWFGWCAKATKRSLPSFGSHLLAVTKQGAAAMLDSMEKGILRNGHWDQVLKEWLTTGNYQNPKVLGASFCWPSVGYFQTHVSGCEPGIGTRVAVWDQTYVQAGVRPQKKNDRSRWLACWPAESKGGAEWLEEISFDSRRNQWITQRPPDRWWSTDNEWQRLLWNRWWVDGDGNWVGPKWAAEVKGKGKGKGKKDSETKQSPSPVNKWQDLCNKPDEYEWDFKNYCYVPMTRLAEQVVVDWDNWNWNGKHTARVWNTRKKAIAMYKRRVFPESEEEQATTKKYYLLLVNHNQQPSKPQANS